MREMNPMLGLRGIRLGILYTPIIEMQVRAIMGAACELTKEGVDVRPEIMIPLVGHVNELKVVQDQLSSGRRRFRKRRTRQFLINLAQ